MEITFLGGAGEVGRSAVFVDTGRERFLLDYGMDVQGGKLPLKPPTQPDAAFITHAHLDHSGFVPGLYGNGYAGKTFATPATIDISHLLLEDSIKVQKKRGMEPVFSMNDMKRMERAERMMQFREPREMGSSTVELLSAGHIPGAAMVSVESRGKRILYTGDVKFMATDFMFGADAEAGSVDAIVSESTYSYKNHPDREELKEKLIAIVEETCQGGGVAIVPAFAVGRTQELLIMLRDIEFPVYVDGMGIRAAERMLSHPGSFLNPRQLERALDAAHGIRNQSERKHVAEEPSVILTTAGMLQGGPVGFYIDKLAKRKDCAMVLTGYQVEGTPGRNLVETGVYENGEISVKPEFPVHFLDFSAHTDRDHLLSFYKKVNPGKVILVHGDSTKEFAEELRGMGFDAEAPVNGGSVTV